MKREDVRRENCEGVLFKVKPQEREMVQSIWLEEEQEEEHVLKRKRTMTMKDITTITDKDKENANIVFIVIIEEQSNAEDILFAIMAAEHVEVKDVFVNSYAQNM